LSEAIAQPAAEQELITKATNAVRKACMSEAGFPGDYGDTVSVSGDVDAAEDAYRDPWWGVSQPQYAQMYGYRDVPPEEVFTYETTSGESEPPGNFEALYGVEWLTGGTADKPGGCSGEADSVIYAGTLTQQETGEIEMEIESQVESLSRTGPGLASAVTEWSQCMRDDGYDYADPHAAFADFAVFDAEGYPGFATSQPDDEEIRTAVADATCKVTTEFWEAVATAKADAEDTVMDTMRMEVESIKDTHARWMDNATAAIVSLDAE
jgi:hypothetical protein